MYLSKAKWFIGGMLAAIFVTAQADLIVPMHLLSNGKAIGAVTISKSKYGLIFTPKLRDLPPGIHGFHIHLNPSCSDKGMAAGGHWDPKQTGKHLGPYGTGHLGDLPVLDVNARGLATIPVLAPRLHNLLQLKGHTLMIHIGGDNYSDVPEKLGGGGARIACGVIK